MYSLHFLFSERNECLTDQVQVQTKIFEHYREGTELEQELEVDA